VRPLPPGVQPLAPAEEELSERDEDRVPIDEALPESALERPSWERTGLGEDDEPVDAYGTPLSLIESLRKAREELVAIPESPAAEAEPEPVAEISSETVLVESDEDLGDDLLADEDEDEEGEEEEADEDEDADEEEADEDEVELFADEDEDALLEEAPAALAAPQELEQAVMAESEEFSAETGAEELVEIAEELVPASELELPFAEPVADPKAIAQTTIFDFTGEEQAGVELFPEGVPEPPVAEAPAAELPESELVQQPAGELEDGIELDIGEEPEVVLQPQAAPAERAHKSFAGEPQRAKLLAEAGCLFVERGRVAVSMLQRQYGMDFDEACKVLDELQDLGLIGPYLGGQRRDILLTRDQWLEKAGAI
jgi:DNA segregation ATPase FtsK/SpoIIIE-like protein